jgi:hypothetical protein
MPIIASFLNDSKDITVKIINDDIDDYIVKGYNMDSIIKLSKF